MPQNFSKNFTTTSVISKSVEFVQLFRSTAKNFEQKARVPICYRADHIFLCRKRINSITLD